MSDQAFRRILGLFGVVMLVSTASAWGDNVTVEDWHFRESLTAIRDWEATLERLDKATSGKEVSPVLPLAADGQWVEWPNPIPQTLIPAEDRQATVRLRLIDGKVEVESTARDGKVKRQRYKLDESIVGYKHPGGGGKDQWYHAYHRKFDRLTAFRVRPAPVAVKLVAPPPMGPGRATAKVVVRNVAAEPITVNLRWQFHLSSKSTEVAAKTITLAGGEQQDVELPIDLQEGGGLLGVSLEAAGQQFWLPLLTHVEKLGDVFKSIDQILAERPDAAASQSLAKLRERSQSARGDKGNSYSAIFLEASDLRDALLLRRIPFDTLLFVKRKPYFSEQPFMDAHHLFNRPGGGIYRLSLVGPQGKVTPVVDSLGEGVYRDLCLHWNGRKLLFSFGNGSDRWTDKQSYHIYEVNVDGSGLRRLTTGPKNDCEPFYMADGRIGFTSDRSEHFVMCGGDRHAPTLFVMEADGSQVRQLSFNVFNDYNPTMLPDGRILYSRWEYNERSVTSLHNPFTMNPDGTMVQPYYGNATIRPNVVMFPRPVPGSSKVMALFTAHHGQTHGPVGLIDTRKGIDGEPPLTVLTPNVPITGEKAEDSRYGWFSDPMPLAEDLFLCSYTPTIVPWHENTWALYVADRRGNLGLVYRDPAISCAEPVPVVPREAPHVRPSAPASAGDLDAEATLMLADVYRGLTGVPRGAAKYLRVLEDLPRKSVPQGGVITTSGTLIFTIKRVFGTVPVESDGSAHFVVPANRNVYFEVLDKDFREIQRMRSVVCLKPGEARSCIGCHEGRNQAPPAQKPTAAHRRPDQPQAPPWGTQTVSYLRDIQPLINAKCASCHTYDRPKNKVVLTDDLTDQFVVGYEELLPYLTVAISNRWDNPDDVRPRPPYTYGSKVSPLTKLVESGHHGVSLGEEEWRRLLTWIDCNGVYYDRYETNHYPERRIFSKMQKAIQEVFARRCESCHAGNDGRHDTWWLSLNRRDVAKSRMLAAPLAQSAGGWGRCEGPVFADTNDRDYQALLKLLTGLQDRLQKAPREDLLSIRGTEAEAQAVVLPPPPPPTATKVESLPKDWVWLSDLPWESARSGWSRTGDNLPLRNKDIEGNPLRIAKNTTYRKGIGTHAPSEIVYALDGKYQRFQAVVGPPDLNGSVVFQVFGDDQKLFDSGVLRSRHSKDIDIPIAGVRRLRLVVTDAGDGYVSDSANWAAARLQKAKGK